jgi:hypothetical protein
MTEKQPMDLNALRQKVIKENSSSDLKPEEDDGLAINTLERFEALPIEEQLQRARAKGYVDEEGNIELERFIEKHYSGIDINKLREIVSSGDLKPIGEVGEE